jgi:transcriptional regulator with XRE-family HTH domain
LRQALIDTIVISMTPTQSRMARAALKWSLSDLAEAAGVGRATVARFELGETVAPASVAAMRAAFEAKRVRFVDSGRMAGAVYLGLRPTGN